jgi:hypothetical protein
MGRRGMLMRFLRGGGDLNEVYCKEGIWKDIIKVDVKKI